MAYRLPKQPAHLTKGTGHRISGKGKTQDDAPLDHPPVRVQYCLPPDRAHAVVTTLALLKPILCDADGNWTADYVRLRFYAVRD